ncbi:MAG: hypothetical protein KBA95_03765 [Acidobacteria bacterium]|nr:hypothetical protein [Acidobacteriota bacterium]
MFSLRALAPAFIGVAVLAPVAAGGTVVWQGSLEALVRAAERIVVTEVIEVRAERARGDKGDVPATLVTLRVLETLKGRAALQAVLEVPGGRLDNASLDVSGMPRFEVGDRDVLFLHETPGMLSPIVGIFAGRFRVQPAGGSSGFVVRSHDGGPLPAGLLPSVPGFPARTTVFPDIELSAFTRAVRRVAAGAGGAPRVPAEDDASMQAARPPAMALPGCLRVRLGPSPALSDGCRDWACAVARSVEAARPFVPGGTLLPAVVAAATPAPCADPATIEWGTTVHARQLDDLTLAVVLRAQGGATDGMRIVLNGAREWNARDGQPAGAGEPLDVVAVLSAALTALAAGQVSDASKSGKASRDPEIEAGTGFAREPRRLAHAAAGDPCDGSGALVNPRLLVFDSPDHSRMTGYQVGFFLPGAAAAAGIVNLGPDAFLERLAFDLPPWEIEAMGRTLVAPIASAGLSTPPGRVFTYRVRGVWAGGTTAWSGPSDPFVRCPQ